MRPRVTFLATLSAMVLALWPVAGLTETAPVTVVQDRLYRAGIFLVLDALVENSGRQRIDQVEVSVELYDFFDQLLGAEYTYLRPFSLGPGQTGTLRIVSPYTDGVRKLRYRFTWREAGQQLQTCGRSARPRAIREGESPLTSGLRLQGSGGAVARLAHASRSAGDVQS